MEIFTSLSIIGIILLVGVAVVYAIANHRKKEARKKETALAAGFTPFDDSSSQVSRRIMGLFENPRRKHLELSHLWLKRFPDGEMYLYDLKETSGESDDQLADQDLLFVSSYLRMPRFTLIPRLDVNGKLGEMFDHFMRWAVSAGGFKPLESLGNPEFDDRYWVSGPDHAAIQQFLTPDRLAWLADTQSYHLEAEGDAFTFNYAMYGGQQAGRSAAQPDLNQKISQGMQIYNWLSS